MSESLLERTIGGLMLMPNTKNQDMHMRVGTSSSRVTSHVSGFITVGSTSSNEHDTTWTVDRSHISTTTHQTTTGWKLEIFPMRCGRLHVSGYTACHFLIQSVYIPACHSRHAISRRYG